MILTALKIFGMLFAGYLLIGIILAYFYYPQTPYALTPKWELILFWGLIVIED